MLFLYLIFALPTCLGDNTYSINISSFILKFIWNLKGFSIATIILKKKNKIGSLTFPDFKIDYQAIVIKTVWYWHEDRHIDQWNRIENPEINLHLYGQMIYNWDTKRVLVGKGQFLSTNSVGKIGYLHAKE